ARSCRKRKSMRISVSSKGGAIYGLMAEFDEPLALVLAAHRTREAGYTCVDAYSPYPIEELHHALHTEDTKLPLLVLIGRLVGCIAGDLPRYVASRTAHPP